MEMKRNKLYSVIQSSLALSLATCLATTVYAQEAEEEEAAELDKVLVTGSRIKRVDAETAQPVTIITREEIDLSGDTSVAELLRNLSSNTFGSWVGRSGWSSGSAGEANIDLRGVGATLVLIDGRRMAGSGNDGGQTQNLNNIPLAIVERVEILRGGASAIYGSDAVGGVVNIITLREYDGMSASVLYETRGVDDGHTKQFEFTAGVTGDRGNMLVTMQHTSADPISDLDMTRPFSGVSWYSPVVNANYYSSAAAAVDPLKPYVDVWNTALCGAIPNTVDQGFRCGYSYSNVTWFTPQQNRDNIMTKFNYELTPNLNFNARLSYVGNRTHARFAATPISTTTPTMQFDNPNLPADIAADIVSAADPNVYLYHRSALLGTRDSFFNDQTFDVLFGLEGYWNVLNGVDWQVNYQYTVKDEDIHSTNLINDLAFQNGIDDGAYDIFNVAGLSAADWSEHALAFYKTVAHTGIYDVQNVRNLFDGNIGGELFYTDNMILAGVIGVEIEQTDFTQIADPESGAGFISGGAGGDDVIATRDRLSAYGELSLEFGFGLELSGAIRYDEYDQDGDVGDGEIINRTFDDTTYMVTAAWRPMDNLLLRAVAGTAFRAPTMNDLFASRSFGFPSGYDYYYCDDLGNPSGDTAYCNALDAPQLKVFSGGNSTLTPETADTMNIGLVWNVTDNFSVEAGWYDIVYDNKIVGIGLDDILLLNQAAGGDTANVVRKADGTIESVQSGTINLDSQETDGIDFAATYTLNTDVAGTFVFQADATKVLNFTDISGDAEIDRPGSFGYPDLRANMVTSWSMGNWFASWRMRYIAGQDNPPSASFDNLPSQLYHNLQAGYYLPWDGQLTVGVRNATDEDIPFYNGLNNYRFFEELLYPVEGQTWYVRYKQTF